jgi:hypothetical protein
LLASYRETAGKKAEEREKRKDESKGLRLEAVLVLLFSVS